MNLTIKFELRWQKCPWCVEETHEYYCGDALLATLVKDADRIIPTFAAFPCRWNDTKHRDDKCHWTNLELAQEWVEESSRKWLCDLRFILGVGGHEE